MHRTPKPANAAVFLWSILGPPGAGVRALGRVDYLSLSLGLIAIEMCHSHPSVQRPELFGGQSMTLCAGFGF